MIFKDGDRVLVAHDQKSDIWDFDYKGELGVLIMHNWGNLYPYAIIFDNKTFNTYHMGDGTFIANDLFTKSELYKRIKDTKIARKLNRDNIIKTEDGWIYLTY